MNQLFVARLLAVFIAGASALAGCQTTDPYAGWNTYRDPQDQFMLRYPADWTQTEANSEIQFWDSFDDGRNSVKVTLTQQKEGEEIHEVETPFSAPSQTREYRLNDITVKVTALFNDDTPELRAMVAQLHQSLKPLKPNAEHAPQTPDS